MNPKIAKLTTAINKAKARISDLETHVADMERQRTELENTDLVAAIRSQYMTPQELAEFIKSQEKPAPQSDQADITEENKEDSNNED